MPTKKNRGKKRERKMWQTREVKLQQKLISNQQPIVIQNEMLKIECLYRTVGKRQN